MSNDRAANAEKKISRVKTSKIISSLWPLVKPHSGMLFLCILLVFVTTSIRLYFPLLTQKGFDGFIIPANSQTGAFFFNFKIETFYSFCFLFLGIALTHLMISLLRVFLMEHTGKKIIFHLRCKLFSHMTLLPVAYYDKNSSGRLTSRVTGDIENMNNLFSSVLIFIFNDLVILSGTMVLLFYLNPALSFYLSLLLPIIFLCLFVFSKILRNAFRVLRYRVAEINHSISEAVMGVSIVQSTDSQEQFSQRFRALNLAYFKDSLSQIKIHSLFMPIIRFFGLLSVAFILWFGSQEVYKGKLTVGELIAFLSYIRLFFQPLRDLSEKFNLLQKSLASTERIVSILNKENTLKRPLNNNTIRDIGSVCFDKVSFSYDGQKNALNNISFTLTKGNSLGIVGETGAGKSSIINLIAGFYSQNKGKILINNIDLSSINIEDIRNRTALVTQDPVLFTGSIRKNIQPQGTTLNDDVLNDILHKANCGFLFEKFDGLNTELNENGHPLSSGEKQLVCIARAFALDPDLIIFDEATSYIDSQSEQNVHDAIRGLAKGRLSIIIAHRLSTIKECNNILVLRDGQIREDGSHEDLLNLKKEYYHLLEKEKI